MKNLVKFKSKKIDTTTQKAIQGGRRKDDDCWNEGDYKCCPCGDGVCCTNG